MKKNIIFILILVILLIVIGLLVYLNTREGVDISDADKEKLLQNITAENESILTSGNNITVITDIKNNNSETIKIKTVKITLINDYNEKVKEFEIKVNKKIKAGSSIKISKTVKINTIESRVFTEYEFKI